MVLHELNTFQLKFKVELDLNRNVPECHSDW